MASAHGLFRNAPLLVTIVRTDLEDHVQVRLPADDDAEGKVDAAGDDEGEAVDARADGERLDEVPDPAADEHERRHEADEVEAAVVGGELPEVVEVEHQRDDVAENGADHPARSPRRALEVHAKCLAGAITQERCEQGEGVDSDHCGPLSVVVSEFP